MGKLRNPCPGIGHPVVVGYSGIGHQCAICGLQLIPHANGIARRHGDFRVTHPPAWTDEQVAGMRAHALSADLRSAKTLLEANGFSVSRRGAQQDKA